MPGPFLAQATNSSHPGGDLPLVVGLVLSLTEAHHSAPSWQRLGGAPRVRSGDGRREALPLLITRRRPCPVVCRRVVSTSALLTVRGGLGLRPLTCLPASVD